MASLQQRRWSGEVAGPSRRDRRPCAYEVYLPDLLQGRRFSLDGDVAAEVTRTETALIRLDTTGNALANSEALSRLLLCAESVASSRIEGLEIGAGGSSERKRRRGLAWNRATSPHGRSWATSMR